MAWREELLLDGKASFRGEEFLVRSATRTVGRRTVVHEYPGGKFPFVEDLGLAAGRATLEAYVIGDDYLAKKFRLHKAFSKPGAGVLVHPYWGVFVATVEGTINIRETPDEGGMARFSMTVVESGEETQLTVVPAFKADVLDKADGLLDALGNSFEEAWETVEGVTEAVRDAAQALIDGVNGVTSMLNSINGKINAAMNIVDSFGDSITALADTAAALILTPAALVSTFQDIATDMYAGIATVTSAWDSYFTDDESADATAGTPESAPGGNTPATGAERVKLLKSSLKEFLAYGDDQPAVDITTPSRQQESDNQKAMDDLVKGSGAAEGCRTIAETPIASKEQADDMLDFLMDELDELAETATDEVYAAIADLQAAVSSFLINASASLPRVITFTPAETTPALVLAHQLYGDSKRDIDIIDRNNVRNPTRVPGLAELEVLSDA